MTWQYVLRQEAIRIGNKPAKTQRHEGRVMPPYSYQFAWDVIRNSIPEYLRKDLPLK